MKKKLLLAGLLLSLTSMSYAQSANHCKQKEHNLQTQLEYAKKYSNTQRAENLKRAIANVKEYCGKPNYIEDKDLENEKYKKDLTKKISKQQDKIKDAKKDLKKAEASEKTKKIHEKTEKLEKRQNKLDYYLQELKALQ